MRVASVPGGNSSSSAHGPRTAGVPLCAAQCSRGMQLAVLPNSSRAPICALIGRGAFARCASNNPNTGSSCGPAASMQSRYEQAYSMAELYAQDRPPPIDPSEHERRRRVKDIQEVVDAGRRRGLKEDAVRSGLQQLETLLPAVLSLHRMKPADWAGVAVDVNGVAEKLITLKTAFPKADIFKVVTKRPKTLLKSCAALQEDAERVRSILHHAPDPDAIIEALPDLIDPISLTRSLSYLASAFAGQDPVMVLHKNPDVVSNMGEASVEMVAEYGELSTKD